MIPIRLYLVGRLNKDAEREQDKWSTLFDGIFDLTASMGIFERDNQLTPFMKSANLKKILVREDNIGVHKEIDKLIESTKMVLPDWIQKFNSNF